MAEPIETLFGLKTRVGTVNHVLDGGPNLPVVGSSFKGEKGGPL